MATWCIATRQTPETYRGLSYVEREAFLQEAKRMGLIKVEAKGK